MASKITIKRSTAALPPAGLSFGELAFVQGTGLTADRLYVGISGGSPVWIGAEIGTTGTWTDTNAQTSLATQYAIEQRIGAKISANTAGVATFNGATGAVTGVSSFNGLTGAVSGVTTSVANTFTALNTFSAGISTTGGTFGTPTQLVGTNITGTATNFTASNVTTNANLTGAITSVGNGTTLGSFSSAQLLTALTDETGSGLNVFGTAPSLSLPRYSISATVSAAGTVQGTATALTSDINVITTATFGSATGVVLPTAVAGVRVLVRNAHATVAIKVYPASGASIDNATVNVAKTIVVLQTLEFVAISSTEWQSNVRVTDNQILRNNDFTVDSSTFNFSGTTLSAKRSYILPDADGTIALVGNKLSTFAATTSAELANVISDETGSAGSGKLVFNTSPTITTSLLTASSTFALLNDTATTINFAGGATALNIGNVSGNATFAGNVIVNGDSTVQGNTTTLNTSTLNVEDFNITMGLTLTSATLCTGAGIGIGVGTGITFAYDHSTSAGWLSSVNLDLASAKVYKIGGTSVLSSSALGSGVTGSSLTQVGTITSGTWNGTAITDTYLAQITTASKVANSATTATNANTASAIVARDASGNFSAGTITAALTGNASTATSATSATTATNANNIAVVSDTSDDTCFVTFVTATSGNLPAKINSTLTYNAVSGELSATLIDGGSF